MANRRQLFTGFAASGVALAAGASAHRAKAPSSQKVRLPVVRSRVLLANDLSGDVDGLFAAAHALMSSNAELRGIIGTATTFPTENSTQSVKVAEALLEAMGMAGKVRVHEGAASRLVSRGAPIDSAGSRAIIE